ncbi:MAG: hypothetical protein HYY08_04335 [Firmicutes bacterium]|nr:hypothetical protein [Bacillota bacterium]
MRTLTPTVRKLPLPEAGLLEEGVLRLTHAVGALAGSLLAGNFHRCSSCRTQENQLPGINLLVGPAEEDSAPLQVLHSIARTVRELEEGLRKSWQELGEVHRIPLKETVAGNPGKLSPTSKRYHEIAQILTESWMKSAPLPVLSFSSASDVDLRSSQGRWELVALAVLQGARVTEPIAEDTFLLLRSAGLLEISRVAQAERRDSEEMLDLLKRHYRGLTSKDAKLAALVANARIVQEKWSGDIGGVLAPAAGGPERLLENLRQLKHVKGRATWIARELKRRGVWPGIPDELCAFIDSPVRLALAKLGLVRPGVVKPRDLSREECLEAVKRYFNFNTVPLLHQGRTLCSTENLAVCAARCPVSDLCAIWEC